MSSSKDYDEIVKKYENKEIEDSLNYSGKFKSLSGIEKNLKYVGGKIKNSKVGRFIYNNNLNEFSLYHPQVEGKILKDLKDGLRDFKDGIKNIPKRSFNYVKEHPKKAAISIGGGIAAAVALYCDYVIFNNEPLQTIARYYLGRKPNDINFMPPVKPYYGSPQGISIVSLNPLDAFSVYEPPIYGLYLISEGVKHILDKPKKSKEP
jgi:hypothetical protein